MRICAFALVAGMALLHCLPRLPHPAVYAAGAVLAAVLIRHRVLRAFACFTVGFMWAMWRADVALDQRLDPGFTGRVATLTGRVIEPPDSFGIGIRLLIRSEALRNLRDEPLRPRRLLINWYGITDFPQPGTRCVLKVRLYPPRGALNPGGFDREKWLFRRRVGATGSVLAHPENRCERGSASLLGRFRERLADGLRARSADQGIDIIAALTIADRDGLDDAHWSVLRNTGTAHLLAISGLHISLVAGAAFLIMRACVALLAPVGRRWPAQLPAAIAAVCVAGAYTALAGFPVSAGRALVMLTLAMACVVGRRPAVTVDNYAFAMAAVAILDPFVLLGAGFWLSFAAVGCLLLVDRTRRTTGTLRRALRLHLVLAFCMTPLLGLLYQSVPLASPLANLVAVPVVTFAIVPCALGGAVMLPVSETITDGLWGVARTIWSVLWEFLCWIDTAVPALTLPFAPTGFAIAISALAVALVLVPVVPGARVLGPVLCSVLLLGRDAGLTRGTVRVSVLDVGQGLAAVIETASHALVYDAGPAHGRYSAGALVVAPFLRAHGVHTVDHLVLSHGDADHSGGWPGLAAAMPIERLTLSPGHNTQTRATRCRAGQSWAWDGVTFSMLYPDDGARGSENDLSCVLLIVAPGGRILLPGDIERAAEVALVDGVGSRLRADIVIAPHHGSNTSSSRGFIAAVAPRYVVFAAGYRNRFDFPRPEVVAAYRARGATTLTTAHSGAITFVVDDRVRPPRTQRETQRRYWHAGASREPDH